MFILDKVIVVFILFESEKVCEEVCVRVEVVVMIGDWLFMVFDYY